MERNCRVKVAQRTGEMSDVAGLLPECRSAPSTIGRYLPPIAVCRRSTDCCRRSIRSWPGHPLPVARPSANSVAPFPALRFLGLGAGLIHRCSAAANRALFNLRRSPASR